MKTELVILEAEAARGGDEPTEIIRELSDMRGRLNGIGARTRLVNAVVNGKPKVSAEHDSATQIPAPDAVGQPEIGRVEGGGGGGARGEVVDMDKRIALLEKLIGSSGTSLDEVRVISIVWHFPLILSTVPV